MWQQSCWLVVPLLVYSCKHSVELAILSNLYQVSDKAHIQPLGKRKIEYTQRSVLNPEAAEFQPSWETSSSTSTSNFNTQNYSNPIRQQQQITPASTWIQFDQPQPQPEQQEQQEQKQQEENNDSKSELQSSRKVHGINCS
ncbi:unnamed protein product [Didymodactylos carnosus]|uniref:Uncharacterized protein n=1 Tax=Didymodactylos carnosus TaxID=1234261 RepID=A0A8S2DVB6_9BILA|nr:unnamed protein product [Didymodactylos carnosus]CAF3827535.1 unnamed protein product [Didymodactylos carnosus]